MSTNVTQKKYAYDEVVEFCSTNGPLDSAVQKLQEDLKKLRVVIEENQELFHGKGTKSSVYRQYSNLLNNVGQAPNEGVGNGMWNIVKKATDVINVMYTNAINDKKTDEAEDLANAYRN